MRPALLLVDVQYDFLELPSLEPPRESLCGSLGQLLRASRQASLPIFHVQTQIEDPRERMPHWIKNGVSRCVAGSKGVQPPERLKPVEGEVVITKRFFSAFTCDRLNESLKTLEIDTVILGGLLLRACIRTTAIDAYQRGYKVLIASDAVSDSDPIHGMATRHYLQSRVAVFFSVDQICRRFLQQNVTRKPMRSEAEVLSSLMLDNQHQILDRTPDAIYRHENPCDATIERWQVPIGSPEQVSRATAAARRSYIRSSRNPVSKSDTALMKCLLRVADQLVDDKTQWARQISMDTGKPISQSCLEVDFAVGLVRHGAEEAVRVPHEKEGSFGRICRRPHGVVAIVTPWNNPLAIPLGKIAPALLYGNSVVWKPALAGASLAARLFDLFNESGLQSGLVSIVQGDGATAETLMNDDDVDAVSLTGSSATGFAAQVICGRRRIPLQAELGGNNAAIVWPDADLENAAHQIAQGAFGCAGQRCTANRRIIVHHSIRKKFTDYFRKAMECLIVGDPLQEETFVGPVISREAHRRIETLINQARATGAQVIAIEPTTFSSTGFLSTGCFHGPTLVCCSDSKAEIVQEESFGPVAVLQQAHNWDQAIDLCNGVRQGLVAAIFTRSSEIKDRFLNEANAGLLKFNQSTAAASSDAPFGGWKYSGIGPPEHGIGDREFYTRIQAVYSNER